MAEKEKLFPIFIVKSKYVDNCPICKKSIEVGEAIFLFPNVKNKKGKSTIQCIECGQKQITDYIAMCRM